MADFEVPTSAGFSEGAEGVGSGMAGVGRGADLEAASTSLDEAHEALRIVGDCREAEALSIWGRCGNSRLVKSLQTRWVARCGWHKESSRGSVSAGSAR